MLKKFNYFFQALFIYLFFFVARILGIKISRKIFSLLFLYLGPVFKSKKIIEKNIKIFSQDISVLEEQKIINNMWKNYGMTFIEYIFLDYFKKNSSHMLIEGEEVLFSILKRNKPVIFISGHFANFELMSIEITKKGIPLAAIYRPLNNLFLNPLMEYLRKKYVCENQIKKGINGVKKTIEHIKSGHSIALMIDQRVSEGEKIKFFNSQALTTTLPAQLILKYDLKVVPIFIQRNKSKKFLMEIFKPIDFSKNKDKFFITNELNKVLENMIIKNPNQWIWTHNRWK